jgi:hypothetical protein
MPAIVVSTTSPPLKRGTLAASGVGEELEMFGEGEGDGVGEGGTVGIGVRVGVASGGKVHAATARQTTIGSARRAVPTRTG